MEIWLTRFHIQAPNTRAITAESGMKMSGKSIMAATQLSGLRGRRRRRRGARRARV